MGRNSLLLLNVPPNTEGLVSEPDVRAMAGFRERLAAIFKTDLAAGKPATASNTRASDRHVRPATGRRRQAGDLLGHRRRRDGRLARNRPGQADGVHDRPARRAHRAGPARRGVPDRIPRRREWKTIVRGTTIGRKKLDRFAPVTARRVRLVIDKSLECPLVKTFGLY